MNGLYRFGLSPTSGAPITIKMSAHTQSFKDECNLTRGSRLKSWRPLLLGAKIRRLAIDMEARELCLINRELPHSIT